MRTSTKQLTILSSSLVLACASAPPRPHGEIAQINAPSKYKRVFNFDDFDENLQDKKGGTNVPISGLSDLHRHWCMDVASKESLQAYVMEWKNRYVELKKKCDARRLDGTGADGLNNLNPAAF